MTVTRVSTAHQDLVGITVTESLSGGLSESIHTGASQDCNVTSDAWLDPPFQVDLKSIFTPVLEPADDIALGFLTHKRVYYHAQLHLWLYYSLVHKTDTTQFDEIYKAASENNQEIWRDYIVGSAGEQTIGDYSILELCIDIVMLKYMMPHLTKNGQSVITCKFSMAFELVYLRLLRHLCAFIEAYIDLNESEARAMMTLKTAKQLLCQGLNRQGSSSSAGNTAPNFDAKLEAQAKARVDPTHALQTHGGTNATEGSINPTYLLKQTLAPAECEPESSSIADFKLLHRTRMGKWYDFCKAYKRSGFARSNGLERHIKTLMYLIGPIRFPIHDVYHHVDKQSVVAMKLAEDMVDLVCRRLYPSQEDLDDEGRTGLTGDMLVNRWKAIIGNVRLFFVHFTM